MLLTQVRHQGEARDFSARVNCLVSVQSLFWCWYSLHVQLYALAAIGALFEHSKIQRVRVFFNCVCVFVSTFVCIFLSV